VGLDCHHDPPHCSPRTGRAFRARSLQHRHLKISNTFSACCLTDVVAVLLEGEVAFDDLADVVAGCRVAVG
jgi:hypothetical protein